MYRRGRVRRRGVQEGPPTTQRASGTRDRPPDLSFFAPPPLAADMYSSKHFAVRTGRVQKLDAVTALADRKRAHARAAARAAAAKAAKAAPSAGAEAQTARVARRAGFPALGPYAPASAPVGAPRRAVVPAREPNSLLSDVDDEVLEKDISAFLASGADLMSLLASVSKPVSQRKLNGEYLSLAKVYRAWCAELHAARVQGRPFAWFNVFKALPNAAYATRPGSAGAGAKAIKNYCMDHLTEYLAAHPADGPPAPGKASVEQQPQKVPSQKVPGFKLKIKLAPAPHADCDSPRTPYVPPHSA